MGMSFRTRQPVVKDLVERFPVTFELTTISLLLAIVVGVFLGVESAIRKGSFLDHIVRPLSVGGISIPVFWTGVVLIFIFYFQLQIAPAPMGRIDSFIEPPQHITGMYTFDSLVTGNWEALISSLRHIALPVLTLAFAMTSPILRLTRNSMLEALGSRYVQTGFAMGLSFRIVVYRDALRNALLPIVTSIGMIYGWSLGGEVLVEVVFSWPGMGSYAVNSIASMDFAPVQGFVLLMAFLRVVINLLVDVLYALIDPRIAM
jgi:peptide/nickel transport system permease protein